MKRIAILIFVLAFVAACGCAPVENTDEAAEATLTSGAVSVMPDVEKVAAEVDAAISEFNKKNEAVATITSMHVENAPLCIVKCAARCGECSIIYPRICGGEAAKRINETVCSMACGHSAAFDIPTYTDYSVEYNRNGILSIRMYIYDLYNTKASPLGSFALNFNSEAGELLTMSDLFTKDGKWRGEIPDIIARQADETDIVLLSELPPIDDDQQFYITSDGIVLTYGLYEIATFSAGAPEFRLTVNEVADFVADDSAINCFVDHCMSSVASETSLSNKETCKKTGRK